MSMDDKIYNKIQELCECGDDLTDLEIQKKISDNIKNSELIVLENTKHNLSLTENESQ